MQVYDNACAFLFKKMLPFLESHRIEIEHFLQQIPRHRLIVWNGDVSCIPDEELKSYWNVGSTMASRLDAFYESKSLSMEFDVECNEEKNLHCIQRDGYSYIVMYNFGILFDPLLGFDINAFVNNISRNTIVVLINKGKYEDGRLYLSKNIDTDSMKFFINLKDINHIVL